MVLGRRRRREGRKNSSSRIESEMSRVERERERERERGRARERGRRERANGARQKAERMENGRYGRMVVPPFASRPYSQSSQVRPAGKRSGRRRRMSG